MAGWHRWGKGCDNWWQQGWQQGWQGRHGWSVAPGAADPANPWGDFQRGRAQAPDPPRVAPPGQGSARGRRQYKKDHKYLDQAKNILLRLFTAFQEASKSQPTGHFDVVQVAEEYLVWEAYEAAHTTNHREKACHDIPTALCVATSQSKPSRCNAPTSNRGGFIDRVSRRAGTVHRGGAAGTREGAVDVVAGYRGWPSWLGTAGAGTVAAVTREG